MKLLSAYIRFVRLDAKFFFELHVIHKEKYMRVCLISIKLELFYVVEELERFTALMHSIFTVFVVILSPFQRRQKQKNRFVV